MSEKISARLQTSVDDEGNRKDIHLITTSDEVIVNPDTEYSETLTQALKETAVVISNTQPKVTKTTVWYKPVNN